MLRTTTHRPTDHYRGSTVFNFPLKIRNSEREPELLGQCKGGVWDKNEPRKEHFGARGPPWRSITDATRSRRLIGAERFGDDAT